MSIRILHAREVCPDWPRAIVIETQRFQIVIPLPWLELYRYKPDPAGIGNDVIPVRLIPPDSLWRDQDSQN